MQESNSWLASLKEVSDIELLKILNQQTDQYEADFLKAALNEFKQREIDLEKNTNLVKIRYNYSEPQTGSINEARSKLEPTLDCWDVYYFTNVLDDTFLVQHIYFTWIVHVFDTDYYSFSFSIDNLTELSEILTKFLKLEDWESEKIDLIDDWEELAQMDSYSIAENLIRALVEAKIPFSVKKPDLPHFNAIYGTYYETSKIVIVVPGDQRKQAMQIMEQILSRIEQLQDAIEINEGTTDYRSQIERYTELEKYLPDDAILYFNKGSLFYELGEFQAAADALIESMNIQFEKNQGVELNDIKTLLQEIYEKLPTDIPLLHALATLARTESDTTSELYYYTQILKLDPADSITHLYLGYLFYHQEGGTKHAEFYFQQYLKLEPEAEDREAIEDLLFSLSNKK